jgi:hypothetical protein
MGLKIGDFVKTPHNKRARVEQISNKLVKVSWNTPSENKYPYINTATYSDKLLKKTTKPKKIKRSEWAFLDR